jgi:hypothetical protein
MSLKQRNTRFPVAFLSLARSQGNQCWVRRLNRIVGSAVFNQPLPMNPCTRRMQQASAMSVSLVTASTCGVESPDAVAAAAIALVTSAVKDNCTFASAVATAAMSGERAMHSVVHTLASEQGYGVCCCPLLVKQSRACYSSQACTSHLAPSLPATLPPLISCRPCLVHPPPGLPSGGNITSVYTAAITKAGQRRQQSQLGNAFAAAAVELDAATGELLCLVYCLQSQLRGPM